MLAQLWAILVLLPYAFSMKELIVSFPATTIKGSKLNYNLLKWHYAFVERLPPPHVFNITYMELIYLAKGGLKRKLNILQDHFAFTARVAGKTVYQTAFL